MKKRSVLIVTLIVMILSLVLTGTAVWAHEAPGLITVEEPDLSETGLAWVEWGVEIPVNAADVEVTEDEVEEELDALLAGKNDSETDEEFVERYSATHTSQKLETLDDLREYVRDDLYHSKVQAAIADALVEKIYIDSYSEETFALLKEYAQQELEQEAEMYEYFGLEGWDAEMIAEDLGYASVEDFLISEAKYYGTYILLLDTLAEDLRITYNNQDIENAIRDLMDYYGYTDEMTMEEYIEYNGGDPWLLMVEKLNVEYHKVLSEMEKYAVIEDGESLPQTETEAVAPTEKEEDSSFSNLTYFTATTLDGELVNQDILAGKDLTILDTWATWCGFCIEEMPVLAEYASQIPDNIQMVSFCIDGEESKSTAEQILADSGLAEQDVTVLVSGSDDLEELDSEIVYFPTIVLVNSKGEVVGSIIGAKNDLKAVLDEQIQQALGTA